MMPHAKECVSHTGLQCDCFIVGRESDVDLVRNLRAVKITSGFSILASAAAKSISELNLERRATLDLYVAAQNILNMFEARPDMLALVGPTEGLLVSRLVVAVAKCKPTN